MKMLKKLGAAIVGAGAALMATASQAAFDVTAIAAEKAEYISNVEVGILLGVTFALVVGGGMIIIKFINRTTK